MEARGEGNISNLDYLTMFADYRVPQGLVYLGALRYSDALMKTLKNGLLCCAFIFTKIASGHIIALKCGHFLQVLWQILLLVIVPQVNCWARGTGERWRSGAAPSGVWRESGTICGSLWRREMGRAVTSTLLLLTFTCGHMLKNTTKKWHKFQYITRAASTTDGIIFFVSCCLYL